MHFLWSYTFFKNVIYGADVQPDINIVVEVS